LRPFHYFFLEPPAYLVCLPLPTSVQSVLSNPRLAPPPRLGSFTGSSLFPGRPSSRRMRFDSPQAPFSEFFRFLATDGTFFFSPTRATPLYRGWCLASIFPSFLGPVEFFFLPVTGCRAGRFPLSFCKRPVPPEVPPPLNPPQSPSVIVKSIGPTGCGSPPFYLFCEVTESFSFSPTLTLRSGDFALIYVIFGGPFF